MRNNFIMTYYLFFIFQSELLAENLKIKSSEVKLNNKNSSVILKRQSRGGR